MYVLHTYMIPNGPGAVDQEVGGVYLSWSEHRMSESVRASKERGAVCYVSCMIGMIYTFRPADSYVSCPLGTLCRYGEW